MSEKTIKGPRPNRHAGLRRGATAAGFGALLTAFVAVAATTPPVAPQPQSAPTAPTGAAPLATGTTQAVNGAPAPALAPRSAGPQQVQAPAPRRVRTRQS